MLLQNGATVNSRADHRTCLQIMYWSKFRPENFVQCSELLVRYGTDVNAMDHNNNTALDYLAWELGQKWYQISKGTNHTDVQGPHSSHMYEVVDW